MPATHLRLLGLLALLVPALPAQNPEAVIVFHFQHTGLAVPEYTFTVHQDGTATYAAVYAAPVPDSKYGSNYPAAQPTTPAPTTQSFALSQLTTQRLFERIRSTDHFRQPCASKLKNIADTGTKTLTYTAPDGTATCTYNYTEDKPVAAITDTFQAIAQTLDAGRTIEFKHRYDRLGLDRELANLTDQVRDGHAIEINAIAPTLQSLCDDLQVLERVRKRASALLQAAAH